MAVAVASPDDDNCPAVANADQADTDGDGLGDACDPNAFAPTVLTEADDTNGFEGSPLNTSGACSDGDGTNTLTITKLSGVGVVTGNAEGTWSWTYTSPDDDSGTVVVQASDGEHAAVTDSFHWSAANVEPFNVSASFASGVVGCGTNNATLNVTFADPGADTWNASIDWGDGNPAQTINGVGKSFSAKHTYGTGGPYTATVTITDDDGGSSGAVASTNSLYVGYQSDGILQPINLGSQRSLFKYGSVMPVKLQVKDCAGNLVPNLTLRLRAQMLTNNTPSGSTRDSCRRDRPTPTTFSGTTPTLSSTSTTCRRGPSPQTRRPHGGCSWTSCCRQGLLRSCSQP